MHEFLHLLAFGAGTFCLGAGVIIMLIVALASRHGEEGAGCVGGLLVLMALILAGYFFMLAI